MPAVDTLSELRRRPLAEELSGPALTTAYHRRVSLVLEDEDGSGTPVTEALDPVSLDYRPSDSIARGIVTTLKQELHFAGLALGDVIKSVSLAPGEAHIISHLERHRTVRASGADLTTQNDSLSDGGVQSRALNEIQEAATQELLHGSSRASSITGSVRAGVIGVGQGGAGFISGATDMGTATTVSRSSSEANAVASATQAVRQAYSRASEAARGRRATSVRESSSADDRIASGRVLTNYNRMHALNILYFELLEVYRAATSVVSIEECLFLPLKWPTFGRDIRQQHRPALIRTAKRAGMVGLAAALIAEEGSDNSVVQTSLAELQLESKQKTEALESLEKEFDAAWVNLLARRADVTAAETAIEAAKQTFKTVFLKNPGPLPSQLAKKSFSEWTEQERDAATEPVKSAAQAVVDALLAKTKAEQARDDAKDLRSALTEGTPEKLAKGDTPAGSGKAKSEAESAKDAYERGVEEEAVRKTGIESVLDRHRELFGHAIWLSLDPSRILSAVRGKTYRGESLQNIIDPTPVAVFGDLLAVRIRGKASATRLKTLEAEVHTPPSDSTVAVPTGGLFAETVLSRCNGAELLDPARRTNWEAPPLSPAKADFGTLQSDSEPLPLLDKLGSLDGSAAVLASLAQLPTSSLLGEIKGLLTATALKGDASTKETVALLTAALAQSGKGADESAKLLKEFGVTAPKHSGSTAAEAALATAKTAVAKKAAATASPSKGTAAKKTAAKKTAAKKTAAKKPAAKKTAAKKKRGTKAGR